MSPPLFVTEKLIAYQREFHALKERLRVAEHRTLQRSSELNTILEQFRRAIAETNSSKDALTNFSGNARGDVSSYELGCIVQHIVVSLAYILYFCPTMLPPLYKSRQFLVDCPVPFVPPPQTRRRNC